MTRLTLTLTALLLTTAVHAADQTVVVQVHDAAAMRQQITAAAVRVCTAAIAHNPFDDFGSLDECIENTTAAARPLARMTKVATR